jgi:transcriptional regulator with XRE-family HTH domain
MRIDPDGIPARIAYWRNRRGYSQQQLAARMQPPRSRSWAEKIESGERQSDFRIGVLDQVAAALSVPVERLLFDEEHRTYLECVDEVEAAAIRTALARYDVATARFDVPAGADPLAVDLVARQAAYGWDGFQAAHFSTVARLLPALIVDAQRTASADSTAPAWSAASSVYQLAAAISVKYSDGPTAWQAADRGVTSAERSDDPVTIASAARRCAEALICLGEGGPALDLCLRAAERLEADLRRRGPEGLSLLGSLFLKAAICAASAGDAEATMALIAQARTYATMLGYDGNAEWTGFGPTNVSIHEVATLTTLEQGGRALSAAAAIDPAALRALPRERQVHHHADLAIAQIQAGQFDAALSTLLYAERLAAQEVHCRPRTRETIARLAESTPVPSDRLRALARRSGVLA